MPSVNAIAVEREVDERRRDHAAQRGHRGEDRRASLGERTDRHLAPNFHAGEQEEEREQAFGEPLANRHGERAHARAHAALDSGISAAVPLPRRAVGATP